MNSRAVSCIVFLLMAAVSYAQEIPKEEMIKQIIETSGLGKQMEQYPAIVIAGIENQRKEIEAQGVEHKQYLKLLNAVKESFRAELFYNEVFERLLKGYKPDYAKTVLNWLSSPLSRKMANLEIEATTVQSVAAAKDFAEQMKTTPPTRRRVELVRRLDLATRATEQNIEMDLAVTEAMLKVLAPLLPPDRRMSDSEIQSLLNSRRREMKKQEPSSQIAFLFTYRSVSDDELAAYIDGYETDAGIWLNGIISESLKQAMVSAAANAARRIAGSVA